MTRPFAELTHASCNDATASEGPSEPNLRGFLFVMLAYHKEAQQFDERSANALVEKYSLMRWGFNEEVIRLAQAKGYLVCKPVISVYTTDKLSFPALELTEAGVAAAWRVVRHEPEPSVNGKSLTNGRRRHKPRWDRPNRSLYYGDALILHFRREAPNQMGILDAFQELHWPARIDDPLPPRGGVDRRERLYETIRSLNEKQVRLRVDFQMESGGQGVHQSLVEA